MNRVASDLRWQLMHKWEQIRFSFCGNTSPDTVRVAALWGCLCKLFGRTLMLSGEAQPRGRSGAAWKLKDV